MGLASRLLARLLARFQSARIIHPDGRVTRCLMLMDTVEPPFGSEHVATIVAPLGVAFRKGVDELRVDDLPPRTFVRVLTLSRSAPLGDQETRLGPLSSCGLRLP
jgi:hypothetical protein